MVETSYYFDGLVTGDATLAPYSTDRFHTNWQILLSKTDDEGVIEGYLNELTVTGISGGVAVASGAALVDGSFYKNTTSITVTIPTPVTDPRIDRIVLQKDWGNQIIRITRLAGIENPAPTPPALTQTAGAIWEIPLAQLLITIAGAITVTDERNSAKTPLGPGGGLFHIETLVADGSLTQFDFSDIPQIFRHLKLEFVLRHTHNVVATSEALSLRLNGDAGANYNNQYIVGQVGAPLANAIVGFTSAIVGFTTVFQADANYASQGVVNIPNYTGTVFKTLLSDHLIMPQNVTTFWRTFIDGFIWRDTTPINRITLFNFSDPTGAFVAGSVVSLYGMR